VSDFGVLTGTQHKGHRDIGKFLRVHFGTFATLDFPRQVAVAYGFDGAVSVRISTLIEGLDARGWNLHENLIRSTGRTRGLASEPEIAIPNGAASSRWGGPGEPPHLDNRPLTDPARPAPCFLHMAWVAPPIPSQSTLRVARAPHPGTHAPGSYLPMEMSGAVPPVDLAAFAAPAFERHEHAVVVLIELSYFLTLPGGTRPRDVPRRLMPRFP
jgi:hypothetical protein